MKVTLAFVITLSSFFLPGVKAQNFDIDLLKNVNAHETNFKNQLFDGTSASVIIVNIAAPLGLLTAGLIKHNKKLQQDALFMTAGYVLSTIVTQGSKRIIQRERPYNSYPFIVKRSEGGGYAMPSGHTSAAFCTATSLSLLFPKWYVIAPSYLWAATVGYGRMYEGVHYPSDVLVGALVGAGSAWIGYKAERYWQKKKAVATATSTPTF